MFWLLVVEVAVVLAMVVAVAQVVLFRQMHMQFHLLRQSALLLVQVEMDQITTMEPLGKLLHSSLRQMV
jgi:hypothetical protein